MKTISTRLAAAALLSLFPARRLRAAGRCADAAAQPAPEACAEPQRRCARGCAGPEAAPADAARRLPSRSEPAAAEGEAAHAEAGDEEGTPRRIIR